MGSRARRSLLIGPALLLAYLVLGIGPAGAQETPTTPAPTTTAPAAASPQIIGTLASGSKPIEGVRVTASAVDVAADPNFSGEATSDAEGKWAIDVPGPGTYRVAIDTDTIPEGFALENPDRFELPRFPMFPGATVRSAVFAFQSSEGGGLEAPSTFERLLRLFVSGIRFGLIIGVCSVGLSLIYGTTGLVNFAHGELVTFGALIAWFFNSSSGGPELTLLLAGLIAIVLVRRVRRVPRARVVASDGAPPQRESRAHARVDRPRAVPALRLPSDLRQQQPFVPAVHGAGSDQARAAELADQDYVIMAICLVVLLAVGFGLQRTRLGTAIRAVADERDLAASRASTCSASSSSSGSAARRSPRSAASCSASRRACSGTWASGCC